MFIHNLAARLKADAADEQVAEAANALKALKGEIPGLLTVHAGPNLSPHAGGYGFGASLHFIDKPSLEAYYDHPAHQAVIPKLLEVFNDVVEVDFGA